MENNAGVHPRPSAPNAPSAPNTTRTTTTLGTGRALALKRKCAAASDVLDVSCEAPTALYKVLSNASACVGLGSSLFLSFFGGIVKLIVHGAKCIAVLTGVGSLLGGSGGLPVM